MAIKNNVIDTGLVEFELKFDRGTEKIYFNPNDPEFFSRIADMIDHISDIYASYEDKYENAKESKDKLDLIRELGNEIRDNFDIAFGNNVSDAIFKYVSPHGFIKSKKEYYSFYILDILREMIEKEVGKTSKIVSEALQKANNKHTEKYSHKFN